MSLSRLKWLILILSGLTFIYLVTFNFSTINDHKDFQIYLQKLKVISENLEKKGWDETTVAAWRKSLDIRGRRPRAGKCVFNNIVVALPGDSLQDHLWEYASLLVLREQWKHTQNVTIEVFLAPKSRKVLANVLEDLQVDSIYSSRCFDFKHAKILGHENSLEVVKHAPPKPQMFLLEKGAKRYMDLIHGDLTWLRNLFVLKENLQQEMKQKIFEVREFFSNPNATEASEIYLVCLHLGSTRTPQAIPADYYPSAIESVQLWHEDAGIVVICPADKTTFCKETFGAQERVKILKSGRRVGEDFALLTLCDGNILRSDLGFLAAILNDGETTVFRTHATENDPAAKVAQFRRNWSILQN